jgi:hypothetical protein
MARDQDEDRLPERDPEGRRLGRRGPQARFSREAAEEICDRLAQDESLDSICRDPHLPSTVTVYAWIRQHPAFRTAYGQARLNQSETIADSGSDLRKAVWRGEIDPARARVLASLIKWETACRNPAGYSERYRRDDEREPPNPYSKLSDEELADELQNWIERQSERAALTSRGHVPEPAERGMAMKAEDSGEDA